MVHRKSCGTRAPLARQTRASVATWFPLTLSMVLAGILCAPACQRPPQVSSESSAIRSAPRHDLGQDEEAGGHTLKRHVGRSDDELRERLSREPSIAAASTYSDRGSAEQVIGLTLERNRDKIDRWLSRPGGHPNLVLDYDGSQPIGRTLRRGEDRAQPCSRAVVILKWSGRGEYYVLTSYPECR
jgi:Bacterial CdiA-CT RNAse A domain